MSEHLVGIDDVLRLVREYDGLAKDECIDAFAYQAEGRASVAMFHGWTTKGVHVVVPASAVVRAL